MAILPRRARTLMNPSDSPREERTLAQQLGGAFVVFEALVACAFLITAGSYGVGWLWLTPELEHSHQALQSASSAYTAMLDQEDGLRGYMLVRDARFLEAYTRGQDLLARANQALVEHVGSMQSAELSAAMVRTRLAEQRWNDRWAKPAADLRPDAIIPSMFEGKALFAQYRVEHARFVKALTVNRDRLSQRQQSWVSARVALELLVFIAVLFLALRQQRTLRAAIVDPVAALLRHIRRIRDGQLEETTDPRGPRELAELAQGLNEMVLALSGARAIASSRDEALREHSTRLRQILDASREFSESLNLKYVVSAVHESTAAVGGYERVIVWLMDDLQKCLIDSEADTSAPASLPAPSSGHTLAGRAAKSGRITIEGPSRQVRFIDGDVGPVCAIAIPLIVGARVVGVLEARHNTPRVATTEMLEVLEMLAIHAATAIESARLHEVVEERSQVDALTRLLNRRRLDEDLDAECKRGARYARPLALVMLDVDHFKAFNDAHGHPTADKALQDVAEVIAGCVRSTDTAYRYGGEEFCVILRETTGSDAMIFAERMRQRIEHRFASGPMLGITASLGVAEFSADTPTTRALVEAADAAMYEAKHAGRNCVRLSSTETVVVERAIA